MDERRSSTVVIDQNAIPQPSLDYGFFFSAPLGGWIFHICAGLP